MRNTRIELALGKLRAGELDEAESACMVVLEAADSDSDSEVEALQILAAIAQKRHQMAQAAQFLETALRFRRPAQLLRQLASVYARMQQIDKAASVYAELLALKPGDADLAAEYAGLMEAGGEYDQAIALYQRAIASSPRHPRAERGLARLETLRAKRLEAGQAIGFAVEKARIALRAGELEQAENLCRMQIDANSQLEGADSSLNRPENITDPWQLLGIILLEKGDAGAARAVLTEGCERFPEVAELRNQLAVVLNVIGEVETSVEHLQQALRLRPMYPEAHNNLGRARILQHELEEARCSFQAAVSIHPRFIEARLNLADVSMLTGNIDEAIRQYQRIIDEGHDLAVVRNQLGAAYFRYGDNTQALRSINGALALSPKMVSAHINRGLLLLQAGDYRQGWRELEWHLKQETISRSSGSVATQRSCGADPGALLDVERRWSGEAINGQCVLVYACAAAADSLQFFRLVELVRDRGASKVIFWCAAEWQALFACWGLADDVVVEQPQDGDYDYFVALLSLPALFEVNPEQLPAPGRVLDPGGSTVARLPGSSMDEGKLKVGLLWGDNDADDAWQYAIPTELLTPLFELKGIQWFSLQDVQPLNEHLESPQHITNLQLSGPDVLTLSALVQQLDLLISVDGNMVHIAGAMGVETWLLLPSVADWRWLLERNDSPWYPSLRLWRQRNRGEWERLIRALCMALSERIGC